MILLLTNGTIAEMASRRKGSGEPGRLLERVGLRPTPQRVGVLAELMRERDDATAQQLHDRLRARGNRLGLATVYRTLNALADEGVIDALSHRPGELCYRWCGDEHHHHLVCSGCHRVVELGGCKLDPWLECVSMEHGFVATGHLLEVAGICAACRAA
jgi:Fur family ferric uptake transcriptional regulator